MSALEQDVPAPAPEAEAEPEVDAAAGAALLERAAAGWLSNREIVCALRDWQALGLACAVTPPQLPTSGSLHLFDRRRVRAFRRDGHAWQKKGGSQTVREAHEKLKVGSETLINAYYCSREDAPRFQRRCYWLLDGDEGMVLVHYLDSGGGASGPGGVPEVAVRPPRRAAAAAAAAAFAAARAAGRDESGEDGGSSGEDDGGDSGSDADASDASAGVAPQPRAPPPQAPQAQAHGHAAGLDPWDGLSLPWLDADLEAVLCAPPPAAASRPAKRAAPEQRAWPVASALAAPQQQQQQQQLQAKLLDYAPRGDAAAGGSRMLLVLAGGMVSGPIVALFDRVAVPTQWVAPGVLACVAPPRSAGGTVALVLATPHAGPPGAPQPMLFAPLCAPVPFTYRDAAAAQAGPFSPYAYSAPLPQVPGAASMHHAAHAA